MQLLCVHFETFLNCLWQGREAGQHDNRYPVCRANHTENFGSPSRICIWSFGASPFFQRLVRDLTR